MSRDLPLHYWNIARLRDAYACGEATPAEAARACLARIAEADSVLHAFLRLNEGAIAQAAAIAADPASRKAGPLWGVPCSIKDNFDVAGLPTTCHSRLRANEPAVRDSEAYAALARGGAVLLGKNSMHELATGGPCFDLPWPPARNPWDAGRHPGGSSSGSGVAVAAGMACFSLGTDTGGSVRHPATACGIFGFKPSFDAISTQGVVPLSRSLDHAGVLARTAGDVASVMAVVAAAPAERGRYAALARAGSGRRLRRYTVGVIDAFSTELDADPEIAAALDDMISGLRRAGCRVRRVHADPLAQYAAVAGPLIAAEAYADHGAAVGASPMAFAARTRKRIMRGMQVSADEYARLQDMRRSLSLRLKAALGEVDVALALSSLRFPCGIEDEQAIDLTYDRQARTPFNLAGLPAIAVPAGIGRAGLPLGVQFAANEGRDVELLEFCMALEAEGLCRFVAPPRIADLTSRTAVPCP